MIGRDLGTSFRTETPGEFLGSYGHFRCFIMSHVTSRNLEIPEFLTPEYTETSGVPTGTGTLSDLQITKTFAQEILFQHNSINIRTNTFAIQTDSLLL